MTDRHAQQRVTASLSRLLILPLPEATGWQLSHTSPLAWSAELDFIGGLDGKRARLHQWAAALSASSWQVDGCAGRISVRGWFEGVLVEVWARITAEQAALGVAELEMLDEPAEAVTV